MVDRIDEGIDKDEDLVLLGLESWDEDNCVSFSVCVEMLHLEGVPIAGFWPRLKDGAEMEEIGSIMLDDSSCFCSKAKELIAVSSKESFRSSAGTPKSWEAKIWLI